MTQTTPSPDEATVHACTEVCVGVWTRTFCGLTVMQTDRDRWITASRRRVRVTRRPDDLTCQRCERASA